MTSKAIPGQPRALEECGFSGQLFRRHPLQRSQRLGSRQGGAGGAPTGTSWERLQQLAGPGGARGRKVPVPSGLGDGEKAPGEAAPRAVTGAGSCKATSPGTASLLPAPLSSLNYPFSAFPWPEEKASVVSPSRPAHRPSFQTCPPLHRDRLRSPGSSWAGTCVTNSAQGVDYPSQPSPWLASHLHSWLPRTPAPSHGLGAPKPPARLCPTPQLRREAPARAVPRRSCLAPRSLQLPARRARSPCARAAGGPRAETRDARPPPPAGVCDSHRWHRGPQARVRLPEPGCDPTDPA